MLDSVKSWKKVKPMFIQFQLSVYSFGSIAANFTLERATEYLSKVDGSMSLILIQNYKRNLLICLLIGMRLTI